MFPVRLKLTGSGLASLERFEAMNRAIEATRIKPVVGDTFPLVKAGDAFALMARGGHFGKIGIDLAA